jgi:hypothetical protein
MLGVAMLGDAPTAAAQPEPAEPDRYRPPDDDYPALEPPPPGTEPARRSADQKPRGDEDEEGDENRRPYALFQAGGAFVAIPFAELCNVSEDDCQPGETSLGITLHSLARLGDFGFGAGITYTFGLRPTNVAGDPGLERKHSRSYFQVEGEFRYYPPRLGELEWWVGATVGGVVINDSWTTPADREPYADTAFVGPRSLTLSTEGLAAGIAIGGQWRFYDQFILGTRLRYGNWLLPPERERTPLGDLASFAGRIDILEGGVVLGYMLPI